MAKLMDLPSKSMIMSILEAKSAAPSPGLQVSPRCIEAQFRFDCEEAGEKEMVISRRPGVNKQLKLWENPLSSAFSTLGL